MKLLAELVALLAGLCVIAAFFGLVAQRSVQAPAPEPMPVIVPVPTPAEPREPEGGKRRRRPHGEEPIYGESGLIFGQPAPDGAEPMVDYPDALWFKNINSARGGDGMCVFTAFEFSCLWSGLAEFKGFRNWCAQTYPGGGYPSKLYQLVKAYCKAKGIPPTTFDPDKHLIQYEGSDFSWLERVLANGWLPGCTLFHSPRYGSGTIFHMTNCAHLDGQHGAILDNNFRPLEWSDRKIFEARVMHPDPNTRRPQYWGFAVIAPGPPPAPTN